MADVATGLVVGGAVPPDPFEAALEAKGVVGGGSSAVSSVADGLTFGDQTAEPVIETDTSGAGTAEVVEGGAAEPLHEDPEVAAFLAKFDGDPDKALKSAVEAAKLIGTQGNELGELRQTVAKLEGIVETIQRVPAPQVQEVSLSRDQIDDSIAEHGGLQLATWAANNAPHLVDPVLEAWGETEAFVAMKFDREYQTWKAEAEAAKATPPEPSKTDAYIAEQIEAKEMEDAMKAVAVDFPNFAAFAEFLNPALDASPKLVQQAVLSDDEETRSEALTLVFQRAEAMQQATLTDDVKAAEEAKRSAGKQTARVIRGQAGTPAPPVADKDTAADETEGVNRFKASILAAETTSVRDGLTYGK